MKWLWLFIALCGLLSSGCLSTLDLLQVTETKRERLVSETPLEPRRMHDERTLSAQLTEGGVEVTLERQVFCREELEELYEVNTTIERSLPAAHWGILGAGILFAGGGAGMIGLGLDWAATLEDKEVGNASEEEKRDQGAYLIGIGAGVSALGVGLLVSELIDAFAAVDEVRQDEGYTKVIPGETSSCLVEADSRGAFQVTSILGTANLIADAEGKRLLSATESPLKELVDGPTLLQLSCEGCQTVEVQVMP